MSEKRKKGAGFVLAVLTIIVTAAGLMFYLQNCKTAYFSNMGVDMAVALCLGIAIVLEILWLVLSVKQGAKVYLDVLPVACGVLTAIGAIQFIGSRIAGAASIMTFENNAQNMADLNNAVIGMALCVAALVCVMVTSFFKVVKD